MNVVKSCSLLSFSGTDLVCEANFFDADALAPLSVVKIWRWDLRLFGGWKMFLTKLSQMVAYLWWFTMVESVKKSRSIPIDIPKILEIPCGYECLELLKKPKPQQMLRGSNIDWQGIWLYRVCLFFRTWRKNNTPICCSHDWDLPSIYAFVWLLLGGFGSQEHPALLFFFQAWIHMLFPVCWGFC